MNGYLAVVKYLVFQNADVNAKNNEGNTPLLLARKNFQGEVAKFLKKNGAEGDCRI